MKNSFKIKKHELDIEMLKYNIKEVKQTLEILKQLLPFSEKRERRDPFPGEKILVSNDKKEWYLQNFYKLKKCNVFTFNSMYDVVSRGWKYWKFPD
jgi:hypothetical protein